ncbi:MFS transporter [Bacteroidetes/Chlorobi group bacterium MS-B_bin-24]|nr:MAG: MFS transporter [Bacteroidetes/Chlorobi group bacterium MS-B_bin-24]
MNSNKVLKEPPVWIRWMVLVVVSVAMFGNYYVYDSISPLADLLAKQLNFTDDNIGLLQGIYSFPNIIMVAIGGIIIDRIGTRRANLLFSALCMIGAFTTFIRGDIVTMATGRLIFGLGAESLIVSITTTLAKWFKGKELSFAFGLNLTIARLGSFAALNSPTWAKGFYENWQGPLLISFVASLISVIAVIIYYVLDVWSRNRFLLGEEQKQGKIELKEIFRFGPAFWFITLLCVAFYSAMFPFQTFAIKFFQEVHNVSRQTAGFLSSILTLSAMIMTPIFGIIVDKVGHRAKFMILGSFLIIPVYLIMAYTRISLFVPMSIMGIAFSLIPAVMWPSVAYVVDESKLGTAYGVMTMIQNIGLFATNILIGFVNTKTGGYTTGMWIFSFFGIFGVLFGYLLLKSNRKATRFDLEKPKV